MSEADEVPLKLRRSLHLNRNALRLSTWSGNPVTPELKRLYDRSIQEKNFPKYVGKFPRVSHLEPIYSIMRNLEVPNRPAYFDQEWANVVFDMEPLLDTETGYEIRLAAIPELKLDRFLTQKFPDYTVLYVDGSFSETNDKAGAGIFIPSNGYRQGTRLIDCYSALSAKLNAIFRALKHIEKKGILRAVICTDSLRSMNLLQNRLTDSLSDKIIYDIVTEIRNKLLGGGGTFGFFGFWLIREYMETMKQIDLQN